ncbi:MAG TPA: hypothetical protein VD837_01730 [Terriglobales bacterium]|nr:hypothetical protein [Terriglobales bacterium]
MPINSFGALASLIMLAGMEHLHDAQLYIQLGSEGKSSPTMTVLAISPTSSRHKNFE